MSDYKAKVRDLTKMLGFFSAVREFFFYALIGSEQRVCFGVGLL